jgi:hypothetical protein
MNSQVLRPFRRPTLGHAPSRRSAVALSLTLLTLASLLVPTRVEAAGAIPVLDVLSLSGYAVEEISSNDHVSSMTASEPRPSCYTGGTNSAWYRITTSVTGIMGARLENYTGVHSIALYQGTSFNDVVELSCLSFPPISSFLQPYMRAGDSLYLQVIADGPYQVSAIMGPTRFIDNFANAEDLSLGFLNFGSWTTENATVEPAEPLPCGGARTAWLKYVPDQSGIVTFTIMEGQNDVLAVYRGSNLAGLELLGCGAINSYQGSDLTSRVETRVTADLAKGLTYYVQIGATQGAGTPFLPLLSRGFPPTNDSPGAALALSQNHSVNATTVGAFTRWLAPNCGIWETVWYLVTAQSSGTLEVTADNKPTGDGNYAPALAIHRADTGELLACGADTNATVTQRTPASAGTSYLIAVMSAGHPGDFRMHWEVK